MTFISKRKCLSSGYSLWRRWRQGSVYYRSVRAVTQPFIMGVMRKRFSFTRPSARQRIKHVRCWWMWIFVSAATSDLSCIPTDGVHCCTRTKFSLPHGLRTRAIGYCVIVKIKLINFLSVDLVRFNFDDSFESPAYRHADRKKQY
jgi:hypothetical protein